MNKIILLAVMTAFPFFTIQAQQQQLTENKIKSEIKAIKEKGKQIREDKKNQRKALRELKGDLVSEDSKTQFLEDFGNIPDAKWLRVGPFDEATFTQKGKTITAYYDYDSELVGTTEQKHFSDLPIKAQQEINNKYKAYAKIKTIFFNNNENNLSDMALYGMQFEQDDNYFVELSDNKEKIVLQVTPSGSVSFFKKL